MLKTNKRYQNLKNNKQKSENKMVIPTSNQDGHQAKNRKNGDEILIVHCCFSISQNELKFKLQLHGRE
jgi:hypothetical protein